MSFRLPALLLLLVSVALPAQTPATTDWPGLRLRDALEALRVIRLARTMSVEQADHSFKPVFLKTDKDIAIKYLRGDDTMWFALLWKGQVIDPRQWWILWDGREVNLAALFSYGEEFDPAGQASQWSGESRPPGVD
jgi:hypothetical protein